MDLEPALLLGDIVKYYDSDNYVIMDECHALHIFGTALAVKPHDVVEFGVGTGTTSRLLLTAIKFNKRGYLTIIDNWNDWHGRRPTITDYLMERGARIIPCEQGDYFKTMPSESVDFLVSDANHSLEPHLIPEFLRVTRSGGRIFVHDANTEEFRRNIHLELERPGITHFLYTAASLPYERTERGLLEIWKP